MSIRKISVVIQVLLVALLVYVFFLSQVLYKNINNISHTWLEFRAIQSEKARLETNLRAALGYNGMIHNFKNYVLRQTPDYFDRAQRSLGASLTILEQYQSLSTLQSERMALEDIYKTISEYQLVLTQARQLVEQGLSSVEIDRQVMVDDAMAVRGLSVLRDEIKNLYPIYADADSKPVIINELRRMMGYAGMIHNFKNYVLRGQDEYYHAALTNIDRANALLAAYKSKSPMLAESNALHDISLVLMMYQRALDSVRDAHVRADDVAMIDMQNKIDDSLAIRGLTVLQHENTLNITKKSDALSMSLEKVISGMEVGSSVMLVLVFMLSLIISYTFNRLVITPIIGVASVMRRMAKGDVDAALEQVRISNREFEDIAESLHVFRESELDRRRAEKEIIKLAMTDPLTGLENRNYLARRYREMVLMSKRDKVSMAVFALDLDNFKPINDEYGHAAGDEVLINVARKLKLLLRETDLVCRMGGDEFVLVLYDPNSVGSINSIAERVIKSLSIPLKYDGNVLNVSASVGVAIREYDEDTPLELLLKKADQALYRAKNSGRNTYCVEGVIATEEDVIFIKNHKKSD